MDFVNHYLMIKEDLNTYKMGYKAFRIFEMNFYYVCNLILSENWK